MNEFLSFTVVGLSLGAIYAIAASGLVVTYTTSGIFNFAHGAFGMMAAFTYWQFTVAWGWPTWLALIVVIGVIAPLFGAAVERVIMRGLYGTSEVVKIVVTVSLLLGLLGLANVIWPPSEGRPLQNFFAGSKIEVFGVFVTYHKLIILAVVVLVAVALRLVLFGTRLGVAMRAVVDDRDLARLNGARPFRVSMTAWALGASLAAVAGVLIGAERQSLNAVDLTLLVINAYAAAVIGQLRSLPRAFLGAILLGLTEAYVTGYVNPNATLGGLSFLGVKSAVPAVVLFVALIFIPAPRLQAAGVRRQREHWPLPTMRSAVIGGAALVAVTAMVSDLMVPADIVLLIGGYFLALVALSLVPLTGWAGQISLAQMTFAGVGGVVAGIVGAELNPLGVLVGVAVAAVVGALVALPALRLTGIYLALATAAFALFMSAMVFTQPKLMPGQNRQVPPVGLGDWAIGTPRQQLVFTAALFGVLGVGLVALRRGRFGRRLAALKDSPVACATLGMNLLATKVGVFALSAAIAGLAGATCGRTLVADELNLVASMPVTMMAVVGGVGAVAGAFFGGLLLGAFPIMNSVFAANAVGFFDWFRVAVSDVTKFMPGLIGISLGRNPNGAVSQMAEGYTPVSRSRPSLAVAAGGFVALWALARTGVIANWTFVAALVVLLIGVVPILPLLFSPLPGRRAATGAFLAAVLALATVLDWEGLIGSNGMRVVAFCALAGLTAVVAAQLHGNVVRPGPEPPPPPDELGLGSAITRSDVIDADRMLGIRGEELSGVR